MQIRTDKFEKHTALGFTVEVQYCANSCYLKTMDYCCYCCSGKKKKWTAVKREHIMQQCSLSWKVLREIIIYSSLPLTLIISAQSPDRNLNLWSIRTAMSLLQTARGELVKGENLCFLFAEIWKLNLKWLFAYGMNTWLISSSQVIIVFMTKSI